MFTYIRNERGSLPYTIMILLVLMIFVPSLLMMTSTAQLHGLKSENEKKATNLAISGMQAYMNYPTTIVDKLNYLKKVENYGVREIELPDGDTLYYLQYVVPISETDINWSNRIVDPTTITINAKYNIVTSAIAGDLNRDYVRNVDETFFYEKKLVTVYDPDAGARTATPIINPIPRHGDTVVSGTVAETNASIIIRLDDGNPSTGDPILGQGSASDNDNNGIANFSISVPALTGGNVLSISAETQGKLPSLVPTVTVLSASAPPTDNGVVIIVDEEGNIEYVGMEDEIANEDQIIIGTGIGENGDGVYDTTGGITLSGDQGITIQPGVSITTSSTGAGAGLTLNSSAGDIVISGSNLTGTGNSQHSEINIVATGDVYLRDAVLTAERSISITAGGNIYAENATLNSLKNTGNITFTLSDAENPDVIGNIYVDDLWLNKSGIATLASGSICGLMDRKINNVSSGNLGSSTIHVCN